MNAPIPLWSGCLRGVLIVGAAICCSGCQLFDAKAREVRRAVNEMAALISNERWPETVKRFDRSFVYTDHRGRSAKGSIGARTFLKGIRDIPNRTRFDVVVNRTKVVNDRAVIVNATLIQNWQETELDRGTVTWQANLYYVKRSNGWRLMKVRERQPRSTTELAINSRYQ
jgi:hypothetical protein